MGAEFPVMKLREYKITAGISKTKTKIVLFWVRYLPKDRMING